MDLTGKQKNQLRTLANSRPVMFQIGVSGLTDNLITNIFDNLRKHEVGRISVLNSCPQELPEIIAILESYGIYIVAKIGRVLLMYKENRNLKDRIIL